MGTYWVILAVVNTGYSRLSVWSPAVVHVQMCSGPLIKLCGPVLYVGITLLEAARELQEWRKTRNSIRAKYWCKHHPHMLSVFSKCSFIPRIIAKVGNCIKTAWLHDLWGYSTARRQSFLPLTCSPLHILFAK